MANPRDMSGLTQWKPGESGNPAGYSKRRRAQKTLRDALRKAIEQEIPAEMLDAIKTALGDAGEIVLGDTIAELLASRLVSLAFDSDRKLSLSALTAIASIEPTITEHHFALDELPTLDASPKHLDDVKRVLGDALRPAPEPDPEAIH